MSQDRRPAPKVLARASSERPNLTVEVREAKRVGALLEVKLALVNADRQAAGIPLDTLFAAAPADAGTLADLVIVDPAARKKCFVLRDHQGRPVSSAATEDLKPGERRIVWARFPLPAPGTRTITVLVPHVAPLVDVPVS